MRSSQFKHIVHQICVFIYAQVAELVDAHGSGPCASNGVEVRVFSWAPTI